jgi:hypothetical protein
VVGVVFLEDFLRGFRREIVRVPDGFRFVVQVTARLTSESRTPPLPLATVHVCHGRVGCAATVTTYPDPEGTAPSNQATPSLEIASVCAAPPSMLLDRTSPVPASPDTFAPTRSAFVVHVTAAPASAPAIVPAPLVTVQVCQGLAGCAVTVTA